MDEAGRRRREVAGLLRIGAVPLVRAMDDVEGRFSETGLTPVDVLGRRTGVVTDGAAEGRDTGASGDRAVALFMVAVRASSSGVYRSTLAVRCVRRGARDVRLLGDRVRAGGESMVGEAKCMDDDGGVWYIACVGDERLDCIGTEPSTGGGKGVLGVEAAGAMVAFAAHFL